MQELHDLKDEDLRGLAPETVAALAHQMLQRLRRQDGEIKFKDAKIEKITFQLARLKAWKFGAKTEAMNAEQKRLFEETLAEDEANLQAQLEQAMGQASTPTATDGDNNKRKPRRQPLPDHLRRVEHHHEPDDTNCPSPGCGKPMKRVGEDVSERLDIVPAEFFVHRHIYGKWACRCCQCLVQEAAPPQIIDGGMPATGLVVHTMISRFVDHVPYYRQEAINARSGVHTPRSTLASWSGRGGAALEPLFVAQKRFVLSTRVLHADETPVAMLDPGAGKTKRAYVWAYARGAFDAVPGVVYDFCLGRGSQYPIAFLGADDDPNGRRGWSGTLVRDEYKAYEHVMAAEPGRVAAGCLAHYLERRFMWSTTCDHRRDAVWRGPWHRIRTAHPICDGPRISLHGHPIGPEEAPRMPAKGAGYIAHVACRSQHQRVQRGAVPEPDRELPPVLRSARSARD
ncbi:IS66 family transposase [Variovorax paradoxus]|uniref:Transposase IS66 family protein n=1 Tax=Variovorax paradoxus TaxID=34073 RepID=A0A0H2MHQ8_VARPD|nr:IS66 family transposase [Variovorax paradoxus]KLN56375.1 transposase IS66 family protein [Variovorax paradoxus]